MLNRNAKRAMLKGRSAVLPFAERKATMAFLSAKLVSEADRDGLRYRGCVATICEEFTENAGMSFEDSVTYHVANLRAGNDESKAHQFIFDRYFDRLAMLTERRLGGAAGRAVSGEDVASIALAEFFRQVRKDGTFPSLHDRTNCGRCSLQSLSVARSTFTRANDVSTLMGSCAANQCSAFHPRVSHLVWIKRLKANCRQNQPRRYWRSAAISCID